MFLVRICRKPFLEAQVRKAFFFLLFSGKDFYEGIWKKEGGPRRKEVGGFAYFGASLYQGCGNSFLIGEGENTLDSRKGETSLLMIGRGRGKYLLPHSLSWERWGLGGSFLARRKALYPRTSLYPLKGV